MCLTHVFSVQELEALDEKQLAILNAAILREIQTSPEIRQVLRKKMKADLYDRWRAAGRTERAPRRAQRPRPRRSPE
jgi:hypothetical protein